MSPVHTNSFDIVFDYTTFTYQVTLASNDPAIYAQFQQWMKTQGFDSIPQSYIKIDIR